MATCDNERGRFACRWWEIEDFAAYAMGLSCAHERKVTCGMAYFAALEKEKERARSRQSSRCLCFLPAMCCRNMRALPGKVYGGRSKVRWRATAGMRKFNQSVSDRAVGSEALVA